MTNNIQPGFNPLSIGGTSKSTSSKQGAEQPAATNTSAAGTQDEVNVTDQASRLQALEGDLKSGSGVNETLISEVKAAIANDSLHMDMAETADKLIEMESNGRVVPRQDGEG